MQGCLNSKRLTYSLISQPFGYGGNPATFLPVVSFTAVFDGFAVTCLFNGVTFFKESILIISWPTSEMLLKASKPVE